MDACDPDVDVATLQKFVTKNTGIEIKLTRAQLCKAYSDIKNERWALPPMALSSDRTWLIDKKSPLTADDYRALLSNSTKLAKLKRMAKTVGAVIPEGRVSKKVVTESIYAKLKSMKILEPIQLAVTRKRAAAIVNAPKVNKANNNSSSFTNNSVKTNNNSSVGNKTNNNSSSFTNNTAKTNNNSSFANNSKSTSNNSSSTPKKSSGFSFGSLFGGSKTKKPTNATVVRNNANVFAANAGTTTSTLKPKKGWFNTIFGPPTVAPVSVPPVANNSQLGKLEKEAENAKKAIELATNKKDAINKAKFAEKMVVEKKKEREELNNKLNELPHLEKKSVNRLVKTFDNGKSKNVVVAEAVAENKAIAEEKKTMVENVAKNQNLTDRQKISLIQKIDKPRVNVASLRQKVTNVNGVPNPYRGATKNVPSPYRGLKNNDPRPNIRSKTNAKANTPKANVKPNAPKAANAKANVKPNTPKANVKPNAPKANVKPNAPKANNKPNVKPNAPKPNVKPNAPKPNVKPNAPKPNVKPNAPKPNVKPNAPKPNVKPNAPKPNVKPNAPKPNVKPNAPKPNVKPNAPKANNNNGPAPVNNKPKVNTMVALRKALPKMAGANANYIRAYARNQNVNVGEINASALKNKAMKDKAVANVLARATNRVFPTLRFIDPDQYNEKMNQATQMLNNKREKNNKIAAMKTKERANAGALSTLMRSAKVTQNYISRFAPGESPTNINVSALKAKANKDRLVANLIFKASGKSRLFGGPKLVFIPDDVYNEKLENARAALNSKQAANKNAANKKAANKQAKLNAKQAAANARAANNAELKKLMNEASVDAKFVRAFANSKGVKFNAVNVSELKAKRNKDMVIAEEVVKGKTFLGKPVKPSLVFVPNAQYNIKLARAKQNSAKRANALQKKTNAGQAKLAAINKKRANTAAINALAKNSGVSASYVQAMLKDRKLEINALNKTAINEKKSKDMVIAEELVKGKTFLGKPVKPTLKYVPDASYNAALSKATANSGKRANALQKKTNAGQAKLAAINKKRANTAAINALAKSSGVSASYVQAMLKNRKLNISALNKAALNKKKNADMIVATELVKGKTFLGKPMKPTLKYIPNKNYDATVSKAVGGAQKRANAAKGKENAKKAKANALDKKKEDDAHIEKLLSTVGGRRTPGKGGKFTRKNVLTLAKTVGGNVKRVNIQMLRDMNARDLKASENGSRAKANRANFEKQLKAKGVSLMQRRAYMKRFNAGEPANSIMKSLGSKNEADQKIQNMMKKHGISRKYIENVAKKLGKAPESLTNFELKQQKKNVQKMGSAKAFPVKTAEVLGKRKTALVKKIQTSIPGAFGQFRRGWESDVRKAKNDAEVNAIERLLNEKVKLRGEIERAKITNAERKGHMRWVMQKRNDVTKRRAELAKHVEGFGKQVVAKPTKAKANVKKTTGTGSGLSLNAAKTEIRKIMNSKKVSADSAFKRLSLKYHPNKGGAKENFVTLQRARNELKRAPAKKAAPAALPAPKPKGGLSLTDRGVRSKLNSKFYDKLTKSERDAFFKRWMNKKNKTIWVEARKIQSERSKKAVPIPKALPRPPPKPTAAAKAFSDAGKKRALAGRLRVAAKRSVAQNIKKANIGAKNKNKMLRELKLKKTRATAVQSRLKTKKAQAYIVSHEEDPHCMSCKTAWSRQFVDTWCTQHFRNVTLRKHRENVLFEREKALFPQTQVTIERLKNARRIRAFVHETRAELYEDYHRLDLFHLPYDERDAYIREHYPDVYERLEAMREAYRELDRVNAEIFDDMDSDSSGETAAKFTRKCPNEEKECPGFLSEDYHCSLCDTYFCEKCNVKIGPNHECDPANVETVKLIKRDSKPCPKCGIYIMKIEGCSQMWCTSCHCVWNFRTGAIQKGRIHNPHYVEFRRAGGTTHSGREHGDIPCGGIPCFAELRERDVDDRIIVFRIELANIQRMHDWLQNERYSTRQTRISYMMGYTSLDRYKRDIQRVDKRREKNEEVVQLYEMFIHTTGDILRQYLLAEDWPEQQRLVGEINAVGRYTNGAIRDIWRRYKCHTPRMVDYITEIIDVE